MRSYGAMAGRYLKQQRRKTILTIIGILLSVALISALGTMGQALKDNYITNIEASNGSYHIGYSKPTPELYETLKKNVLLDKIGIHRPSHGSVTSLPNHYSVSLNEADTEAFGLMPTFLEDGRLPASMDEVVVEQWLLEHLPGTPSIGGTAELTGPDGKPHAYRIVGTLKNQKNSQIQGASSAYTLLDENNALTDESAIIFTLKPGVDISDHLKDFEKLHKEMFTNVELLAIKGESGDDSLNLTLSVIFGTLAGLVVLSTVAVIYNAFHIAVLERIRQFGLLRTLGASPSQIRNLVFREATILALIGVPLGLLSGWFGLWFVLWLMMQGGLKILMMEDFQLAFHWWIMGGSLIVGFLAVYVAAWLPARKASRVSPVDAVKGAGSIVRESYRKLRFPSLLTLLGVEGKMASNNIRRNRTKFRITTFSIVISLMLFIVFHYFTQQLVGITTTTNENDRIGFQLFQDYYSSEDTGKTAKPVDMISDDVMKQLAEVPGVDAVYGKYKTLSPLAIVPDDQFNAGFSKATGVAIPQKEWNGRSDRIVGTDLLLYDNARLKEAKSYLEAGSADPDKLAESDGVLIVQTVKARTLSGKKNLMTITRYKVGDKLLLNMDSRPEQPDKPSAENVREVTVAGILSQSPFDKAYQAEGRLVVIAAKPTFAKLLAAQPSSLNPNGSGTARIGLEVALKDGANPEPIHLKLSEIARSDSGYRLVDIASEQKETRQFNLQMQIFVYGFLIIIGGIGSLNIINTVQTNLLLRRKEIGLLQAVGMTMGQVRKMASAEGVWFGVIGGFWGILLGIGFCYLLYQQLSNVQGFPFHFPWKASLIACGVALLVGLLSVQGPLRRMEKTNLLDELRDEA